MSVPRSTESTDLPISPANNSATNSATDLTNLPNSSHVSVVCDDRWQVYHRLQDLDIGCRCGGFQPLQVEINTPTEALQLWSVLRRVEHSRATLAASLDRCWQAQDADSQV